MRLRTFTAASMKEAIAIVRAEMGPDAIIVSHYERPRGRGVEVRAAVEGRSPAPVPKPAAAPRRAMAQAEAPSAISQIAHRRVGTPSGARRALSARDEAQRAILLYHGLDPARAELFVDAARKLDRGDQSDALTAALDARLTFNPIPVKPRRPIMLVGGPGVGKTVTTAKLAARVRLANQSLSVITTDTLRSGAVEQLGKLLALLGTKLASADSPETLEPLLARATRSAAAVFIDTPGTNVFALGERRDLRRFMAAGDIEPVLVLAAGADAAESAEHAKLYAEIGVRRFIMTRLDAARRLGGLITAADEGRLALAQVSLSPYLSEPLSALTAASLARILLTQAAAAHKESARPAAREEQKVS